MAQTNNNKKRRLTAIDIFAVLIVLACVITTFAQFYVDKNAPGEISEKQDYLVSFTVKGIRSSTAKRLSKGQLFTFEDGRDFGTLYDNVTVTPAVIYTELENGSYVKTYAEDNGENTLVDVSGVMLVSGGKDHNGLFMAGEKRYIAPSMNFKVQSEIIEMDVMITSVDKVK